MHVCVQHAVVDVVCAHVQYEYVVSEGGDRQIYTRDLLISISTQDQYKFLFEAMLVFLDSFDNYANFQ